MLLFTCFGASLVEQQKLYNNCTTIVQQSEGCWIVISLSSFFRLRENSWLDLWEAIKSRVVFLSVTKRLLFCNLLMCFLFVCVVLKLLLFAARDEAKERIYTGINDVHRFIFSSFSPFGRPQMTPFFFLSPAAARERTQKYTLFGSACSFCASVAVSQQQQLTLTSSGTLCI